jgi:hypothetical protein
MRRGFVGGRGAFGRNGDQSERKRKRTRSGKNEGERGVRARVWEGVKG